MIAMIGWLLMLVAARGLAAHTERNAGSPGATADAGTVPSFGWVSAVCAAAAECAIYGGMAAGSERTVPIGIWPLAVITVISISTGELLGGCLRAAVGAADPAESGRVAAVTWWTSRLSGLPAGLRGLLALLAFAIAGPPAALFSVLALEVVAVVTTIAMLGKITSPRRQAGRRVTASAVRAEPAAARVNAAVRVVSSSGATSAVRLIPAGASEAAGAGEGSAASSSAEATAMAGPGPRGEAIAVAGPGPRGEATPVAWPGRRGDASREAESERADRLAGAARTPDRLAGAARTPDRVVQPAADQATARDLIVALRDDGPAARWAGRLVQGNLLPLPPALGGLIATALLAVLGLRHLPGFIALTPPIVMMLAAPGSSHRHDGRFDWLVPVVLALAQYVYLATLGFALAVPSPAVFSVCALIFVWYTGIIAGASAGGGAAGAGAGQAARGTERTVVPRSRGALLGWETRMFTVGLAAAVGLATIGYFGLAACLGVLICRRVMTG